MQLKEFSMGTSKKVVSFIASAVCAVFIAGCGGGGGGGTASVAAPALSGLAATGAGIANAAVTAKCATGTPLTGTTDANGSFNLVLGGRTLPCMLQVTGGTPAVTLHSFAQAAGRVNISPVTDLIVSRALGSDPATVFTGYTPVNGSTVEAGLAAAKTYVATQLGAITGGAIANPLTGAFSVGDADDKILDALANALANASKTVADLRVVAQAGGTMTGTVPAFLAAPVSPTATANSDSQITVGWAAVAGATGYNVYRSTSSPVTVSVGNKITPTPVTTAGNFIDAGLTASTTYYYRVVASNTVVDSAASTETSATTSAATPVAVNSFSPTSGATGATVTINGSGFDADPFHMQVKFSNNINAIVVSSTASTVVVTVPAGAVTGPVTVTNTLNNNSATSASNFTVTGGGGGGSSTWVSRASPSGFLQYGLAYGNGKFVTVGYNRTILTSTDGLSWTSATAPDANYYQNNAVIWTGSQFVLTGDKVYNGSQPAMLATSPDGVTWTRRTWTSSIANESLVAVGSGGGKITVAGNGGTLAYSTDGGVTWTAEVQSHVAEFYALTGNSTTRVAAGRDSGSVGVILVDTGSGWVKVNGLTGLVPKDVTWTGSQFVAVGSSQAGLGNAVSATSADGVTWAVHALSTAEAPASHPLAKVLEVGGTLYATGDNFSNKQIIVKSTDGGASWSIAHQDTLSGNASLMGIAASPSRVVTVGGVRSVTLP